jgi:hypothetical protein
MQIKLGATIKRINSNNKHKKLAKKKRKAFWA